MNNIWLGTQSGLDVHRAHYTAAIEKYGSIELMRRQVAMQAGARLDSNVDDEEYPNPVGYEVVGTCAVLSVEGGTENKSSWFTRYCGIPTYDDIKARLVEAAEDSEVNSVIAKLDTSGGVAVGAFPMAEFMTLYAKNVKPVISYTDTSVASAGILYGTAALGLVVDQYAEAGSVGAVCVFKDYSAMYAQIGIKPHVFRSAPYKAVPNMYEKLDAKGTEILQNEVTKWHNRFVDQLSKNLSIGLDVINKSIANGKMFDAQEAVSLGLAQGVAPFEKLVATMNAKYQTTIAAATRPIQLPR